MGIEGIDFCSEGVIDEVLGELLWAVGERRVKTAWRHGGIMGITLDEIWGGRQDEDDVICMTELCLLRRYIQTCGYLLQTIAMSIPVSASISTSISISPETGDQLPEGDMLSSSLRNG